MGAGTILRTAEPGATAMGSQLRQLLLDPASPPISSKAEALILAADRAEHVSSVVMPALEEGRWVVSDRYSGSTLAYQGYGRGIALDELQSLVHFATGGLAADVNVLVEIPVELARTRMATTRPDRLESLDEHFHERVANGYREIASSDPAHWGVVDGSLSVAEVRDQVRSAIEALIGPLPSGPVGTVHRSEA